MRPPSQCTRRTPPSHSHTHFLQALCERIACHGATGSTAGRPSPKAEGAEGDDAAHQPGVQVPAERKNGLCFAAIGGVFVEIMGVAMGMAMQRTKVQIWLYENTGMRIEGKLLVRALRGKRGIVVV